VQAPKQTDTVNPIVTVNQSTPTPAPADTPQANDTQTTEPATQSPTATNVPTGVPTQPPTDVPTQSAPTEPPPTVAPTAVASSGYKDGQYTGQVADAFYGAVQVQVDIQGGKIANVQFLQYPNDRRTSVRINSQAVPMLQSEALQAQSAQVDIISGATLTSQAFIESLQSALVNAGG
jgi:uncharacterized protein with FMN-binding domain